MALDLSDYRVNDTNNVYFSYGRLPYQEFDDILFGGDSPAEPSRENPLHRNFYRWVFDWTSTLNPRTVLNFRWGLSRYVNTGGSPPAVGFDPRRLGFADPLVSQFSFLHFPRFNIGGFYTAVGSTGPLSLEARDAYSYQLNLNRSQGLHQLKYGAEFRIYNNNRISPGAASGQYSFNKMFTQANPAQGDRVSGDEFAAFLLGYPSGGNVDLNIDPAFRSNYYSLFVHDDFKIHPRLTLNLGVRWDYEQPYAERFNRMVRGFAFDQASPIAGQVKAKNPDVVYFGGTTQSKGGQIAKDMRNAGLSCPLIVPDGCYELAFITSAGEENLKNCYVTMGGIDASLLKGPNSTPCRGVTRPRKSRGPLGLGGHSHARPPPWILAADATQCRAHTQRAEVGMARQRLLRCCEATMERLATDRHYFARPTRRLFDDVRDLFPISSQMYVYRVVERHVDLAREYVDSQARAGVTFDGSPRCCHATTRRGSSCQRVPLPGSKYCPSHKHLEDEFDVAAA